MGCGHSAVKAEYQGYIDKQLGKVAVLFKELGFGGDHNKAAKKMWDCFERLDKDSGGTVSYAEFADFFELEKNPFTERCFLLLDRGATGEINFAQFVLCAWNYCSYDRVGLTRFAYNLYDLDGSGNIPIQQLFSLVEDMYDVHGKQGDGMGMNLVKNSPEYNVKRIKGLIRVAAGEDEMVDVNEFCIFVRKTPILLGTAFTIQAKLQQEICGQSFWNRINTQRTKKTTVGHRKVNMLQIDEVIEAFEQEYPDVLAPQKNKKQLFRKQREADGSRSSGAIAGSKYAVEASEGEGERPRKRRGSVELRQDKKRRKRQEKEEKLRKKQDPNYKPYPKKGKVRKLKRHNSAVKLQAVARGIQSRKNLPDGHREKALERVRRRSVDIRAKKAKFTNEQRTKRRRLVRKKTASPMTQNMRSQADIFA